MNAKQLEKVIYDYVSDHFGQSEADDPSWSIEPLAAHIAAKLRLEYLRGELQAERISYGELAELQSLTNYIDKGDIELLEAAGVPESES